LNSAPRRAGYEAPFVGTLYPVSSEQPGAAPINLEASSEPNTRTFDDRTASLNRSLSSSRLGGRCPRY